ncbi:hypothetical protein ABPG74_021635 [Tetrahymena malaccensis]
MQKLNYENSDKEIYKITVYLRGIVISLGCLYYGFNNSSLNITQQHISYLNGWTDSSDISLYIGLITSSLSLGCLIGSLLTSQFLVSTNHNYRLCLMLTDVLGIIGIIEQIIDHSFGHFLLGRLLAGLACGLNTTIIPIYLKEFTPQALRGKTGTFIQIFAQLGSFLCVCLGIIQPIYSLDTTIEDKKTFIQELINQQSFFEREIAWRLTLAVPILMCLIRLLCLYFVYKQPTPMQMAQRNQLRALKLYLTDIYFPNRAQACYQAYISHVKESIREVSECSEIYQQDYAKQSDLYQSQGRNQNESMINQNIKAEVDFIRTTSLNRSLLASDDLLQTEIYSSFGQKKSRKIQRSKKRRFMLGLVVQTASRVSGLSALTFYSSLIFSQQIKNQNLNYILIVILGLSGFIFTYLSFFFIERTGRKILILLSTVLLMISQLGIAIFSMLNMFAFSFVSIMVFLFSFGIGQGGVTWPYTIELVNQEHVTYCSAVRWAWVLVIGVTFPFTNQLLGLSGTFFTYLGATFLCFLYFLKELKETKGLTKDQVESLYC